MTIPAAIGDRIDGRWEIYQIIEGGMGVVYIVYDHEHRRPYAAKTFRDGKDADHSDSAEEFVKEALTWVNLDVHENVARAEFVKTIQGKPFLFLEYVSGGDLSRWIGTPRLTEDLPQVLRFSIQFCDGMIHAAAKGIRVHRDIKPRNCLITENRTLKIADFGLAKAFGDITSPGKAEKNGVQQNGQRETRDTRTGTEAGTCTHMAPEQFDDVKQVDVRADIYSFGVILFQMLTGKLPFDADTWEDFKQQHQTQTPSPLPGTLPSPLIQAVNSCLSKNPQGRFADFNALRQELAAIYEELTRTQAPKPKVGAKLDAVDWSNKGVSLGHLQRHAEALTCYEHALDLDPQLKEAWNNRGWTLKLLGRHAEALGCYEHTLGHNPRLKEAWHGKGLVLKVLGRHPEALACFDRALALDSRNAEVWSKKGRALQAVGRHAEALDYYNQALTLDHHVVSGKFVRWAARKLLACQRLLKDTARPADQKTESATAMVRFFSLSLKYETQMRFLQKLITTLVGFIFAMGGFGKASAQEPGPTAVGTLVIARENRNPSMNASSYDSQRNRLIALAATKDTKKPTKQKTKSTKKKPRGPHK